MSRPRESRFSNAPLLALALAAISGCTSSGIPFDKTAWQAHDQFEVDEPSIRDEMVDDLLANHLPAGMSEAEAVSLLGQPTFQSDGQLQYWVNDDYGRLNMSPDPMRIQFVTLNFDSRHRLIAAERTND